MLSIDTITMLVFVPGLFLVTLTMGIVAGRPLAGRRLVTGRTA